MITRSPYNLGINRVIMILRVETFLIMDTLLEIITNFIN